MQITQALQEVPPTMQEFQKGLKSYSDINRGRKEVAEKFGERDGKAIQQLRAIVSPGKLPKYVNCTYVWPFLKIAFNVHI